MSTLDTEPVRPHEGVEAQPVRGRRRLGSVELLAALVIAAVLARGWLVDLIDSPASLTFATVFVAVVVSGLPFVVLGVGLTAAVSAFTRPRGRRSARGGILSAVLSSPAANPVVLASTAVAFSGRPSMVLARVLAALATTVFAWWLARRLGQDPPSGDDASRERGWAAFFAASANGIIQAGGFLVVAALAVATLTVMVPARWLEAIADQPVFAVIALALLAVLLCVPAEINAFAAASLAQFSPTAQLVFIVVGPAADLRLFAAQAASNEPGFAVRFTPAVLLMAVVASALVGWVMF